MLSIIEHVWYVYYWLSVAVGLMSTTTIFILTIYFLIDYYAFKRSYSVTYQKDVFNEDGTLFEEGIPDISITGSGNSIKVYSGPIPNQSPDPVNYGGAYYKASTSEVFTGDDKQTFSCKYCVGTGYDVHGVPCPHCEGTGLNNIRMA